MNPAPFPISPLTTMGTVVLSVTDLDRSVAYYTHNIGLKVLAQDPAGAQLGVAEEVLLELRGNAARPADPHASGLYHFALLLPSRLELARMLQHLLDTQTSIGGASDHGVSEALYLSDPDGHGIEIYRDRPREQWYDSAGNFVMTTMRLDVEGVMGELTTETHAWFGLDRRTVMGHVHLQVADVDAARTFYVNVVGLDHMTDYPSATFLSAGGYHHHLGANQWQSAGHGRPSRETAQLQSYAIRVPDAEELARVWARIEESGATAETTAGERIVLDPSGNRLRFELLDGVTSR